MKTNIIDHADDYIFNLILGDAVEIVHQDDAVQVYSDRGEELGKLAFTSDCTLADGRTGKAVYAFDEDEIQEDTDMSSLCWGDHLEGVLLPV